jgi:hypothetical protein
MGDDSFEDSLKENTFFDFEALSHASSLFNVSSKLMQLIASDNIGKIILIDRVGVLGSK